MSPSISRRSAICLTSAALYGFASRLQASQNGARLNIATNTYPWRTFAKRAGQSYQRHTDTMLENIAGAGINGYEPIIESADELAGLGERLKKHRLQMRSIYVNSTLHDATKLDRSVSDVLLIATKARQVGVEIIVTNPSPIRWGGDEDKDDSQLRFQAKSLDRLGQELRNLGLTLAYHNHDAELRNGAREFHHMLTATDRLNVKFCLDAHWIFRGCGNSEVAVMDALQLYRDRIVELHLRQSGDGIWNEAFEVEGDIDYQTVFDRLSDANIFPHLVLEQAVEAKSTNELSATEAHRRGRTNLATAF